MTEHELVALALNIRERAYAPYSGFRVGAALLCGDGSVYTGCNLENASYPCGLCAERVAAAKALSEGRRDFRLLAVAGSSKELCTPCGLCRQFLFEFCAADAHPVCQRRGGMASIWTSRFAGGRLRRRISSQGDQRLIHVVFCL